MTKMKKLRQARELVVYPEQVEAMAKYEHDKSAGGDGGCPTLWEDQSDSVRRMYKGRVIMLLREGGITVEGQEP
ncbi:hypothetical protein [Nesterenkonia jeotgali]|uniref:Uncharacterized protein n=1 Tax=Nesterenkonia jeotgali TaxID=317018 RepID=A0A0W8IGI5_9MICC|nr:hypothetical protein [Nesterenkonia jeotgali]KUG58966.1 hypothetical protein AVL63_02785 [Nesterenkonia jeotgali]